MSDIDSSNKAATFTGVSSARPIYRTGQINGRPGVQFNGSSQYMTSNSDSPTTPCTVFAVVKASNTSDGAFWSGAALYSFV